MARITSLSVLLDPTGKMLLKENYASVIANVQKGTVSGMIKNTDLSGDPTAGTVEAKRFANSQSQAYGTARTAGKGILVKGKTVTIPIDQDREFVEEIEEKDISLLGVEGLLAKRSANHALRMAAELDTAFFACGQTEGTAFVPTASTVADKAEEAILTLEEIKTDYVDGVPRDLMFMVCSPKYYSDMRNYLDTLYNTGITTRDEKFERFHGVPIVSSNRLPNGVNFELMVNGAIAQPVMAHPYAAEKIPLSEAYGVSLFWYYGTKAVTPELILVG